jgi:hypothetical protein
MRIATPGVFPLVVGAFLVLGFDSPSYSQETQKKEEEKKPDPQTPAVPVSVSEYVFVEGSLPYVPRSNTIVTKLPLDRRSTPNNVGFVTEPLAREQFDRFGDALVNVSNVNIQTQNGVAGFLHPRVRLPERTRPQLGAPERKRRSIRCTTWSWWRFSKDPAGSSTEAIPSRGP